MNSIKNHSKWYQARTNHPGFDSLEFIFWILRGRSGRLRFDVHVKVQKFRKWILETITYGFDLSNINSIISKCSFWTASCKGVRPNISIQLTSTYVCNSSLVSGILPYSAASSNLASHVPSVVSKDFSEVFFWIFFESSEKTHQVNLFVTH